ncbi:hypothetical protein [Streptomyces sp. NPDC002746]
MASIVERPKKDGTTTYQVKWRQDGKQESERFGDPDGAVQFKALVEAHGGQWPHGWGRGQGFVEETAIPGDQPFETWATRYVDRLQPPPGDPDALVCRRDGAPSVPAPTTPPAAYALLDRRRS